MRRLGRFWRGEVPLPQAFWGWGILGAGAVSAASTLLALAILTSGGPGWLAALAYVAHFPWNIVVFIGVWRSAERAEEKTASLARMAITIWVLLLTIL